MGFAQKMHAWLRVCVQKTKKLLGSLTSFLLQKRRNVLLVAVVIILTLLVSSLARVWLSNINNLNFPTMGTIRTSGLEAYWDADLTNETKKIQWGQLYLGSELNVTLYLRSISNIPVTLEVITANWTFINSLNQIVYGPANGTEHMTLSWDYDGSTVNPGQVISTILTLRVKYTLGFREYLIEKDVQQFSFDISIHALEENVR